MMNLQYANDSMKEANGVYGNQIKNHQRNISTKKKKKNLTFLNKFDLILENKKS